MVKNGKIIKFLAPRNGVFLVLSLLLVYFIQRLMSYKLGLYREECRDINAYLMVLRGYLPYRDFKFWVYGPFAFCIYPIILKVFGVKLAILRLSYVIIASLTIPLVYYLARRLMPKVWAGLAAFLSVLLLEVPYYTYNHILATISGLCVLVFIVNFIEKRAAYFLFFAGIFIGITILVKPLVMGLGVFTAACLFMLILKFKKDSALNINLSHIIVLFLGILFILFPFLIYFIMQRSLPQLVEAVLPFGIKPSSAFYSFSYLSFPNLSRHWGSIKTILPYQFLFSPMNWKTIIVRSCERLLLFSPVIFPVLIFLLNRLVYRIKKYELIPENAQLFFLLFSLFSVFISAQSLLHLHRLCMSFTIQVPLLLIVYFLFLITSKKIYAGNGYIKYTVFVLTGFFIFSLVFLYFFRIPYARYKKYIAPLSIGRAQNIRVTAAEKQLYESLNMALSKAMPSGPIAVIGYYPQLAFLTQRQNIFGDIEDVFIKLNYLSLQQKNNIEADKELDELEKELISRIGLQGPAYVLKPVEFRVGDIKTKVDEYVNKKYISAGVFGPAEIDIGVDGVVKIYRRRTNEQQAAGS